jgi:hypothetical protein
MATRISPFYYSKSPRESKLAMRPDFAKPTVHHFCRFVKAAQISSKIHPIFI